LAVHFKESLIATEDITEVKQFASFGPEDLLYEELKPLAVTKSNIPFFKEELNFGRGRHNFKIRKEKSSYKGSFAA
jgi:hypothetical protein